MVGILAIGGAPNCCLATLSMSPPIDASTGMMPSIPLAVQRAAELGDDFGNLAKSCVSLCRYHFLDQLKIKAILAAEHDHRSITASTTPGRAGVC